MWCRGCRLNGVLDRSNVDHKPVPEIGEKVQGGLSIQRCREPNNTGPMRTGAEAEGNGRSAVDTPTDVRAASAIGRWNK
jgi:hypothetical protein